jgi:sulfide:quinone oxidoreductase
MPVPARRSFSRRKILKLGAAGLVGGLLMERSYDYFSESTAKAKIVIVGGGAAGITMAAYLSDMLRYVDVTLIEPNEIHHYQPGYTLIAADLFSPDEVAKKTAKLIPDHVKWLKDSVTELNPDHNSLATSSNGKIAYDFLVLVPGCQMDFNLVAGLSRESLGEGNVHCIYDFKGAALCRDAIKQLGVSRAGRLLFTNTYTKIKCGGAPKKICLITEDYLRKRGLRRNFEISYFANQNELMKPKVYGDRLIKIFGERDISVKYKHRMTSVDTSARKAVFELLPEPSANPIALDANYEKRVVDYDFLHFVPPMSAPDFVKNSPVSVPIDKNNQGGWVKVDKETLIHAKFKNIISLGDVAGIPTSKTGAAIRKQAPIAAANLVSIMEGKAPQLKYNGYSACPIITEYGKVLMCEFGYDDKLLPSIPFLDPALERGMWWMLKVHGLKPMYYQGMLKGLI